LDEKELAEVKRFLRNEEEYRRWKLLRRYAEERQARQGMKLGALVESVIAPLGDRYSLRTVSRRGTPLGWRVTIPMVQGGVFEFQCPLEDVETLLAGGISAQTIVSWGDEILRELNEASALEVAS
jgi:hypothetical protein